MKHAHFDQVLPIDVSIAPPLQGAYGRFGKRMLDLALCLVTAPLSVPLVGLLWLLVRLDNGPGFFGHDRIGQNGRRFRCWKIRTMRVDARATLARHLATDADAAIEWALTQKLRRDPRVTRIGRLLRQTRLDEVPQLWNVFRGDMSLVGPRPVTLEELNRYGAERGTYLSLKPGITGLWQVQSRGDGDYAKRVRFDTLYSKSVGLFTDLSLILRTVGVVLRRSGC